VHENSGFDFSYYFPGKLLSMDPVTGIKYRGSPTDPGRHTLEGECQGQKRTADAASLTAQSQIRPPAWRTSLASRLVKWRLETWRKDPLKAVRPQYLLLSDKAIDSLVRVHPTQMANHQQVTLAVGESADWGEKWAAEIFAVIRGFDAEVGELEEKEKLEDEERKKRLKLEKKQEEREGNRKAFQLDSQRTQTILSAQVLQQAREDTVRRLRELQAQSSQSTFGFQPITKQQQQMNAFEMDMAQRTRQAEQRARELLAAAQKQKAI
jgi:hypothetical protein